MKLNKRNDEVELSSGDKFTYLGILLNRSKDVPIRISMPQYVQDIITSELAEKDFTTPVDCHIFFQHLTSESFAIKRSLNLPLHVHETDVLVPLGSRKPVTSRTLCQY